MEDNMTTIDAKHTPTPWEVKHKTGIYYQGRSVCEVTGLGNLPPHIEGENLANADLIIKAVNSYEPMKEALRYYMSQFGQCLDAYGIKLTSDQIKADNQARAALKIAGE
jgi:hypothetical protein